MLVVPVTETAEIVGGVVSEETDVENETPWTTGWRFPLVSSAVKYTT